MYIHTYIHILNIHIYIHTCDTYIYFILYTCHTHTHTRTHTHTHRHTHYIDTSQFAAITHIPDAKTAPDLTGRKERERGVVADRIDRSSTRKGVCALPRANVFIYIPVRRFFFPTPTHQFSKVSDLVYLLFQVTIYSP
jgi:hypothetical protein